MVSLEALSISPLSSSHEEDTSRQQAMPNDGQALQGQGQRWPAAERAEKGQTDAETVPSNEQEQEENLLAELSDELSVELGDILSSNFVSSACANQDDGEMVEAPLEGDSDNEAAWEDGTRLFLDGSIHVAGGELPLHEEPAFPVVKAFESELRKRFQHHQQATIRIGYASDCSGGEAPAVAWQSTIRVLEKLEIISIRFVHEFSSEDPKAHHCHKYIRWNTETRRLYKDLHQRTSNGGPCVFHATDLTEDDEGCIALPPPGEQRRP